MPTLDILKPNHNKIITTLQFPQLIKPKFNYMSLVISVRCFFIKTFKSHQYKNIIGLFELNGVNPRKDVDWVLDMA